MVASHNLASLSSLISHTKTATQQRHTKHSLLAASRWHLFWLAGTCQYGAIHLWKLPCLHLFPTTLILLLLEPLKAWLATGPLYLLLSPSTYLLAEMLGSLHSWLCWNIISSDRLSLTTHSWEIVPAPNAFSLPHSTFPHNAYHHLHKLHKHMYLPFYLMVPPSECDNHKG